MHSHCIFFCVSSSMLVEVELVELEVELELLLDIVTISIRCVIYYIAICCQ